MEYLKDNQLNIFNRTQDLNKYLIKTNVLSKENAIYSPTPEFKKLFIIEMYKGKAKGIKFKNEFIDWIEEELKKSSKGAQGTLL